MLPRMSILLETAHDPGIAPLVVGGVALSLLFIALLSLLLFGATRPHS